VAGVSVEEVVLAAVGFVGDDHDVAPSGEGWVDVVPVVGEEFLDGGEDDSPRRDGEEFPEVGSALCLDGDLAE